MSGRARSCAASTSATRSQYGQPTVRCPSTEISCTRPSKAIHSGIRPPEPEPAPWPSGTPFTSGLAGALHHECAWCGKMDQITDLSTDLPMRTLRDWRNGAGSKAGWPPADGAGQDALRRAAVLAGRAPWLPSPPSWRERRAWRGPAWPPGPASRWCLGTRLCRRGDAGVERLHEVDHLGRGLDVLQHDLVALALLLNEGLDLLAVRVVEPLGVPVALHGLDEQLGHRQLAVGHVAGLGELEVRPGRAPRRRSTWCAGPARRPRAGWPRDTPCCA